MDRTPAPVESESIAERPQPLRVSDITCVRSLTGFCHVAFMINVFTRRIVGWAISLSLRTVELPLLALEHAPVANGASCGNQGLGHNNDWARSMSAWRT